MSGFRQHVAEAATEAAKVAPPTSITTAMLLGYPVEQWILWLTLIWWIWLFVEKAHNKLTARKQRRRRAHD